MSIGQVLFTHAVAHRVRKPPFFFSRFKFPRMKERGNTHYCFHCGGSCGFTPDTDGKATNSSDEHYDPLECHDPATHKDAVVGNADKYDNPWEWLANELPADFPYLVAIPSIW